MISVLQRSLPFRIFDDFLYISKELFFLFL